MTLPAAPRILIVEDEAIVALDIEGHLERLGYRVAGQASSGEEACALAWELRPDLVLLDVRLRGDLDGIEAGKRIREGLDVPVVYLTAHGDQATLDRAKKTGPHGYVLKPFKEDDLRIGLEVALYKHALESERERSRQDLMAVLEVLRAGAVLVDSEGRVTFLNGAARELLWPKEAETRSARVDDLGLPEAVLRELRLGGDERSLVQGKISGELEATGRSVEIEVRRDPRDPTRRILLLYDVTRLRDLEGLVAGGEKFEKMVGRGREMRRVFGWIRDLAKVDTPVLVRGETGTGKELVARALHNRSSRCEGPFIAVNCGGLSEELASSQLFGHRRGAFTGASGDQPGYFEAADGGTLMLDEVGELPPRVQSTLLRALEEEGVVRMGETSLRPVDVRLVAATHQPLEAWIEEGAFRRDLYYRLRVAEVLLPPLRERLEDLPALAASFLSRARARSGKPVTEISDEALSRLLVYSWPGNVREVRNALEFAVIRSSSERVEVDDLPPEIREAPARAAPENQADQIRGALTQAGGNRKRAASLLGISRATLYRRLKQHGFESKGE